MKLESQKREEIPYIVPRGYGAKAPQAVLHKAHLYSDRAKPFNGDPELHVSITV